MKRRGKLTENGAVRPSQFQVKLTYCGTDSCSGDYRIMKSRSALHLAYSVVDKVTKDFVGEKDMYTLQYHLALCLLNGIKFDEKKLLGDIKKANKIWEKCWILKESEIWGRGLISD